MCKAKDSAIGCIGSTIKVFAGHYIDLVNPKPEYIELESAATALSRICRYGGHSPQWYSVAEHCWHATRLAIDDEIDMGVKRAIFLHDLSEAYLGDMVKPLKLAVGEQYTDIEYRMERAIGERFGVDLHANKKTIKHYDLIMLKAEKFALWGDDGVAWNGLFGVPDREVIFRWWEHETAKRNFLQMASFLGLR